MNDKKLINLVKKFKNLYERRSKDYRNKMKRRRAWKEISLAMKVDEISCQTRWKNLRDRYGKLYQRKHVSGSDNSVTETSWHLMPHLEFLKDHIKPRIASKRVVTEDSIKEEALTEVLYPLTEDSQEFLPNSSTEDNVVASTSKKRKNGCVDPDITKQHEINELTKYIWPGISSSKHLPFLQMIEQKLEELPKDHQDDVKLNFITYVFDYVKKLKNNEYTDNLVL